MKKTMGLEKSASSLVVIQNVQSKLKSSYGIELEYQWFAQGMFFFMDPVRMDTYAVALEPGQIRVFKNLDENDKYDDERVIKD